MCGQRWLGGWPLGGVALAGVCAYGRLFTRGRSAGMAARLVPRQNDTTTHDLACCSSCRTSWVQTDGDASLKPTALQAARTLTRRFNSRGGFSSVGPLDGTASERGRAIIDTMMNLDLLFWASQENWANAGSPTWPSHTHAQLSSATSARMVHSHVIDFDPIRASSSSRIRTGVECDILLVAWTGWAVYGFAECYRERTTPRFSMPRAIW